MAVEQTINPDDHGSKKAVVLAIFGNGGITALKFFAALVTGSASMMNESVHSLMDTINQLFLYFGLRQSARPADRTHAFGHGQKKYLWNLWSAIGLFSIGAGLGLAHAWHAWHNLGNADPIQEVTIGSFTVHPIWVSGVVLGIAFVVEGFVLWVAGKSFIARMRHDNETNPIKYVWICDDPTLTAVVLEDAVAVLGLMLAATGIGLGYWLENPAWDIVFSVAIAVVLGVVAVLLGAINIRYLSGVRDDEAEQAFRTVVAEHSQIERFHDLRSVIVDNSHTIVVAEVELREEALVPGLLDRIAEHERQLIERIPLDNRTESKLEQIRSRAVLQMTLQRTEEIVDEIESRVRERCSQVSHMTIEVEGIAEEPNDGILFKGVE